MSIQPKYSGRRLHLQQQNHDTPKTTPIKTSHPQPQTLLQAPQISSANKKTTAKQQSKLAQEQHGPN
jgi:hypothetical protein